MHRFSNQEWYIPVSSLAYFLSRLSTVALQLCSFKIRKQNIYSDSSREYGMYLDSHSDTKCARAHRQQKTKQYHIISFHYLCLSLEKKKIVSLYLYSVHISICVCVCFSHPKLSHANLIHSRVLPHSMHNNRISVWFAFVLCFLFFRHALASQYEGCSKPPILKMCHSMCHTTEQCISHTHTQSGNVPAAPALAITYMRQH